MSTENYNLATLATSMLDALDERSRDIVLRRYGITSGQEETLESIGREYGITRERVRQIQSQAKKALVELHEVWQPVAALYEDVFRGHGGIMAEDHVVQVIRDRTSADLPRTVVIFYLDVLEPYQYVTRDSNFYIHWRHPEFISTLGQPVVQQAAAILEKEQHPLTEEKLSTLIKEALRKNDQELPPEHLVAQLTASKGISRTPFGEWGLQNWAETKPRGVGDKAYAVMRRHGEPEHFMQITAMINQASFDHKTANPQTVHNELIKDARFVLVGRGLYGLSEWGYIPGTVADVIASLLQESGEALSKEEIINRVLAQRQVKKNTILLGLQNQQRFERVDENRYRLK